MMHLKKRQLFKKNKNLSPLKSKKKKKPQEKSIKVCLTIHAAVTQKSF